MMQRKLPLRIVVCVLAVAAMLSCRKSDRKESYSSSEPIYYFGKVIGVSDGDTLKVLIDRKPTTIRLDGIDAPESKQTFGNRSKQALSDLVFGKEVQVVATSEDRFGRTIGTVMLGQTNINEKMVQTGWAWHFEASGRDARLAQLESEARLAKKGLWADPNPIAPWEYRLRQMQQSNAPGKAFWLNTSSNVRHNERCEHFGKSKKGRRCGPSEGKACSICGG
jgi:endonuclease YncB( thermonuclease family)